MPISDMIFCAAEAERADFEYISVAESFYRDASVLSSAIATNTTKIKLGSSVYPIPTRTPFQIAMATATLSEVSNERVGFIGLGVGYRARIEQYFGLKVKNSLSKMKEYAEIIKGLCLEMISLIKADILIFVFPNWYLIHLTFLFYLVLLETKC
jgi:alkanesulfonate monooxygenase SsuD/methylene tetrahydromethanopterin reductase-like flavin-dependent oxidoreductase (luciferase family)